jgi:hypothetical protein
MITTVFLFSFANFNATATALSNSRKSLTAAYGSL